MHCRKDGAQWQAHLHGFEQAPPGQRHLAELFGTVLVQAAGQVENAAAAEQRERERQLQARLAELGSLAATVAHDLRNPLNVIAMATAFSPAEVRQDVQEQIARISRLAEDLLDYAKPWQIEPRAIDLSQHVRQAIRHAPSVELGPGLDGPCPVHADPARLDQVLANLLTNAQAAANGGGCTWMPSRAWTVCGCMSATTGPAFPPSCASGCSSPSPRAARAAPGWAWPSSRASWPRTAARPH